MSITALFLGLLIFGAYSYVRSALGTRSETQRTVESLLWIGFTAEILVTGQDRSATGTFRQHSNGSTRRDTVTHTYAQRVVRMMSKRRSMAFVHMTGDDTWRALPLSISGRSPLRMSTPDRGLSPVADAHLGFSVFRPLGKERKHWLLAPELNFFALVSEDEFGRREKVTSVVLGDPPLELFEPPRGARVRIVRNLTEMRPP